MRREHSAGQDKHFVAEKGEPSWLTKKEADQKAASKEEARRAEERKCAYSVGKRITKLITRT